MKLIPVTSSNISAIGFEEGKQLSLSSIPTPILYIKFKSEKIYAYYGVSKEVYIQFLESESKGKFFHKNIDKKYEFELVKIK